MAINVATVIRNVCLSRRHKADSISIRRCIRTLASLTHHIAQKPDRATAVQTAHNVSRTKAGIQIAVTTKPYIEMSCMSNQRKDEFIVTLFVCGVSGKVMVKFCQKPVLYR
jgi:Na+/melibiose symporter-like transporter